jgi:ATP-dependent DNA helicase RecQ
MATMYPISLEELQNIPGVGQGKARRYGKEFVEIIKRHVEENDIERPEDMRVRTVANKSKMKLALISGIDRKIAFEDLADSQRIEFEELLSKLEAIVYAGTKLNIDYYLEDAVDEDHIDRIMEYLQGSEVDDLTVAYQALGGDISEEEIRLVRIKFISEAGN